MEANHFEGKPRKKTKRKQEDQGTYKPRHLCREIKVAAALVDAIGQEDPIEHFEVEAVMREDDLVDHVASTGKVRTRDRKRKELVSDRFQVIIIIICQL